MRRRRSVFKRIDKSEGYNKTTLEGIIIYIDATDGWCNVELPNGTILYHIYFSQGVQPRLKRVEQSVTLVQTIGKRYAYMVMGAAKRHIPSTEFNSKGTTTYNSGAKYGERWVYG